MGYKVKWVNDNLGVSRKALRLYEDKGLMPKNNGEYRIYSEEDIDRIWTIKVLQGMGYTLSQIKEMVDDENFDFETSLALKVKELQEQKENIEKHLGYAKTIKFIGRFSSRPKVMGSGKFSDFHEKSLNECNINTDKELSVFQEIVEKCLNLPEEKFDKSDIGKVLHLFERVKEHPEVFMEAYVLPKEIVRRKSFGANHPEVQFIVKMIYKSKARLDPIPKDITVEQFVKYESSCYKVGDIARLNQLNFGVDGCDFIAEAIAICGGFKSYDEIED